MIETQRHKDTEKTSLDNSLSYKIIGAAIEVHRTLGGPGLIESIYESAFCRELSLQGLRTQTQVPIDVNYKGAKIRDPLFLDILVEDKIIVEVKATEKDNPIHQVQLLTYLRLTGLRLGLLINFGSRHLKDSISRVING
jgi:GxxExxY protein